jgi:hypothetical protein
MTFNVIPGNDDQVAGRGQVELIEATSLKSTSPWARHIQRPLAVLPDGQVG